MQDQWRSKAGFVLATIGAAVGLGNIWRFAYVAGENGGGVFLLTYLAFVVLIGVPLVIAELSLGRRGASDAVTAFERAAPEPCWALVGWIGLIGAVAILSYYSVIAGWALKYLFASLTGDLWSEGNRGFAPFFARFIANGVEPILWQALMLALTGIVVAGGIQRGIERLNMILMPLLALIVGAMAVAALMLPGAGRGVAFLLAPDWSAFGRPALYLNALGQAFFSIGIGMAVFITYGAYVSRETRIPGAAAVVVAGDTLFAIVAGLAIFPAVFAFGGDPAAGPRLAFVTIPQVLLAMPGGWLVAPVFFFLLSAAALTSMLSLLEVPVAYAVNRRGASRPRTTLLLVVIVAILGIPSALSYGTLADVTVLGRPLLDAIDQAISNFVLPVGGLLVALLVGWRLDPERAMTDADFVPGWLGFAWIWLLRTLVPAMIAIILVRSSGLV